VKIVGTLMVKVGKFWGIVAKRKIGLPKGNQGIGSIFKVLPIPIEWD
jgi:hypothetical protein